MRTRPRPVSVTRSELTSGGTGTRQPPHVAGAPRRGSCDRRPLRLTAESACSGSTRCAICRSKWEKTVTIRRLLKASRLAGLQEVEQRLNRAYRDVLRSLHLIDRDDPIAEIVAKTVIEIGATGVREPSEISKIAVKRLAHLGRPRLEAPTGQEFFADF